MYYIIIISFFFFEMKFKSLIRGWTIQFVYLYLTEPLFRHRIIVHNWTQLYLN